MRLHPTQGLMFARWKIVAAEMEAHGDGRAARWFVKEHLQREWSQWHHTVAGVQCVVPNANIIESYHAQIKREEAIPTDRELEGTIHNKTMDAMLRFCSLQMAGSLTRTPDIFGHIMHKATAAKARMLLETADRNMRKVGGVWYFNSHSEGTLGKKITDERIEAQAAAKETGTVRGGTRSGAPTQSLAVFDGIVFGLHQLHIDGMTCSCIRYWHVRCCAHYLAIACPDRVASAHTSPKGVSRGKKHKQLPGLVEQTPTPEKVAAAKGYPRRAKGGGKGKTGGDAPGGRRTKTKRVLLPSGPEAKAAGGERRGPKRCGSQMLGRCSSCNRRCVDHIIGLCGCNAVEEGCECPRCGMGRCSVCAGAGRGATRFCAACAAFVAQHGVDEMQV